MKLHDKQRFEIDGVPWEFRKGQMPQGTLHAVTKSGTYLAMIRPADWSKPVWDYQNAVLTTRSSRDNQWVEHGPDTIKNAIRNGTQHARGFAMDRQITAMETALKRGPQANHASTLKTEEKEPKFRNLSQLMEW